MPSMKIKIENINPNPNNPRKDVGDVTELAESIKANGILQPLTVYISYLANKPEDNEYILLIGHRRLAAAKLAGETTVPCTVLLQPPTDSEQMAIMLQENMHRQSLTVTEEAEGFQYMLDLGDSIKEVAAMTGCSETKVRGRVKIAALDKDAVRNCNNMFNMQIGDYDLLNKIADPKVRTQILNTAANRQNFEYKVQDALRIQEFAEITETWKKTAKDLSIPKAPDSVKQPSQKGWITVCNFALSTDGIRQFEREKFEYGYDPMEWDEKCCWAIFYGRVWILRKEEKKPEKKEETPEQLAEIQARYNLNNLNEEVKAFKKKLVDTVLMIADGKLKTEVYADELRERIWNAYKGLKPTQYYYFEIMIKDRAEEGIQEARGRYEKLPMHLQMLVYAASGLEGRALVTQYGGDRGKYNSAEAERIAGLVDILSEYGFAITPEEEQILNGTRRGYKNAETGN